jgi:hypothetical protein
MVDEKAEKWVFLSAVEMVGQLVASSVGKAVGE